VILYFWNYLTLEKPSVKGKISGQAVEDLKSPVTGIILERNDAMTDAPEQVADDPYREGWLLKVRIDDISEIEDAMTADEYSLQVEGS
jgi:glycine cleavage system H protein